VIRGRELDLARTRALWVRLGMEFPRAELAKAVAVLTQQNVYVGTSSWKYEGWRDSLGVSSVPRSVLSLKSLGTDFVVYFFDVLVGLSLRGDLVVPGM